MNTNTTDSGFEHYLRNDIAFIEKIDGLFASKYTNSIIKNYFKMTQITPECGSTLWLKMPDFEDKLESMKKLISEQSIVDDEEDSYILLWAIISESWIGTELLFSDKNYFNDKDFDSELNDLKKMLCNGFNIRSISRIEFQTNKGIVAVTNRELLDYFLTFIRTRKLEKFIKAIPYNLEYGPKSNKGYIHDWIRNYLAPLFHYLKENTNFRDKSNAATFRFIHEFCISCGVDWSMIQSTYINNRSTGNPPDEYLKRTFIKLGLY